MIQLLGETPANKFLASGVDSRKWEYESIEADPIDISKGIFTSCLVIDIRFIELLNGPEKGIARAGLHMQTCSLKNIMERFIQQIKDRIECFDDQFPCSKGNCNKELVSDLTKVFILYLHMQTDRNCSHVDRFLNIQHHHNHSSIEKSFIERTLQYIKDRTECFDDYFPCRKDNNDCNELVGFICRYAQQRDYGKGC
ncbi:MAG: hypothetical protein WBP64_20335 [Nitrososphaeraceae archaeon]